MLHDAIHETNSIEEAFEKYTQSSVFEEFSLPTQTTSLYPIPMTYGASDEGVDIVDKIDPPIRKKVI